MMRLVIGFVAIAMSLTTVISSTVSELRVQPEQIHLSLGQDPSQMVATWLTINQTKKPQARYGAAGNSSSVLFSMKVNGWSTKYVDGGTEQRQMYIHRAIMTGLVPGQRYYYHVGSDDGWSPVFWLQAQRNDSAFAPTLAVYGDLGNVNGHSIPFVQDEVQKNTIDAILHVGDFAYDMNSDNARVGDEFMRQIEPIAAYVPYQTCPGNHENAYNFSNYDYRFSMMQSNGQINNHYYSFNYGPAHIISYSTEFYFFIWYGWHQIKYQYQWLEQDLIEATKPENRAKHPWIIVMGHRPMYCSNDDHDDCRYRESIVRKGIPIVRAYGLEDLFYKYGVDLCIAAHEHSYERLWPIYDMKVYNGSAEAPYTNPKAPVHLITGSAGCQENIDPFVKKPAPWSAVRISDYGYTRMKLHNATHLTLQQLSAIKEGKVVDEITIIKDKHGPYTL
ncbi:acid phosphatase type 7-like [Varroa destructor]|uniref:Purple acid phosphatase n=1 Tax=Varroa destructor TaxID=109461 RepID=A0A7M7JFF6_VARDE|nr:acid phosphatase type 7-like [Varroa destructor]